jgi:hypothetical protein
VVWPYDDLPRSSADIPQIEGDPSTLRTCASDLRTLAGDLATPRTAAFQLQEITDGTSWQGAGFEAFRKKVDKNPKAADIENAQSIMHQAADALTTLASGIADCQTRIGWYRQQIDNLNLPAGELTDDVRPQVQRIKDDVDGVRATYKGHMRTAGDRFDELTGKTVYAEPPPGFFESVVDFVSDGLDFVCEFAIGIVEGVWEMVKGLYSIVALVVQPWKWPQAWDTIVAIAKYAWHDPMGFLKAVGLAIVDADTWKESPAKWFGKLIPNIVLAIATGGAGSAAVGLTRVAVFGARLGRLARVTDKLNGVAKVAAKVDKLRVDRVLRSPKVGVLKPLTDKQLGAYWGHMGRRGESLSTQKWTSMGYTKVAKEVTLQSWNSVRRSGDPRRARIDHVFEQPGGGRPLLGVESKNGLGAGLRGDQPVVYDELAGGGVQLRTDKLAGQGLPHGSNFHADVKVDNWYSPVDATSAGSQAAVQVGAQGTKAIGSDEPFLPSAT